MLDKKVNDTRPERTFTNSTTNKAHTGDKTTLARHDRGLSTMINPFDKDSSGNPLSSSMKSSLKRLRQWDSRSRVKNNDERNLQQALAEILKLKEKLSLPDAVAEKASYIYRKALEKKLVRDVLLLHLLLLPFMLHVVNLRLRTLQEITSSMEIKRKELTASYRLIFKELELKMPVVDSVSCIAKIASKADISEKTKRCAAGILKKAEQKNMLAGKHPMGVAASALYLACVTNDEHVTQKIIASAAGITEVTVRNRCKKLRKIL